MTSGLRHEPHRVDTAGLYRWALGVAICLVIVVVLMYLLWRQLAPGPLPAPAMPPDPKLQAHAMQDRLRTQATQRANLDAYRWVDSEHRRAQVPIERAMEIEAARAVDHGRAGKP